MNDVNERRMEKEEREKLGNKDKKKEEKEKREKKRKESIYKHIYILYGVNTIARFEVACSAGDKIEKRVGTKVFESGNRKRTCK